MPRKFLIIRRKGKLKMKSRSVLQLQYALGEKVVIKEYPIRNLDAVLIIGRGFYLESSVLSVLASMNVPVSIIAKDSVSILINPIITISSKYRIQQYCLDKKQVLDIAREYLNSKILGMANILKYHRKSLIKLPEPPLSNEDPEIYELNLRSWEAYTSNKLWDNLQTIMKEDILQELREKYNFRGRKPRHPDPFNKTLSVMYAVLYSLSTKALIAAGLDPTYGFLHRTRYSTPLTFDYTEMYKPIAIQATIELVNKNGLPELSSDGELTRGSINNAIRMLYDYLTLTHRITGKTPYQQIYLKAFCLAKHLEGRCGRRNLVVTWDRAQYRRKKRNPNPP